MTFKRVPADECGCESTRHDYKGRMFAEFYVSRSAQDGPGWYVFGRNPEYGGHLVMLCGRPAVAPRKHPKYNGPVRRGWSTRAKAQYWADQMNRVDRDPSAPALLQPQAH